MPTAPALTAFAFTVALLSLSHPWLALLLTLLFIVHLYRKAKHLRP